MELTRALVICVLTLTAGVAAGDGEETVRKAARKPPNLSRANDHKALSYPTWIAVELGLKWLSFHQDVKAFPRGNAKDGRWDCDGFAKQDAGSDKCTGAGHALFDIGSTGLSLLAFLGAGYTDQGTHFENKYVKNVRMGLRFLLTQQDKDGCFGGRQHQNWIYNHAIATLAICEAYWMTGNPVYREPARRALKFIEKARNPGAGWRYGARPGNNDTSVTAWCVAALHAGKVAGFDVDKEAFKGALAWLDKVTDQKTGVAGYTQQGGAPSRPAAIAKAFPADRSRSMTAAAVITRMLCGEVAAQQPLIRRGSRRCLERLPRWDLEDGSIDLYYWYFGSLALRQMGDREWLRWRGALRTALLASQYPKGSGPPTGSWDPVGAWGLEGGRIYSTALAVLALQSGYRYRDALK